MLTIKQITENTDAVIRGLEKKRFKDAKEMIEKVLELDSKRRNAQNQLDRNLALQVYRPVDERGQERGGGSR